MNHFSPHLEILPAPQRALWNELPKYPENSCSTGERRWRCIWRIENQWTSIYLAAARWISLRSSPVRFMAYAMTYARHEDMRLIREYVSDEDFCEALNRAPPGIIDPRSWAYWNSKMGRYPAPPMPKRHFGDDKAPTALTGGAGQSPHSNPSSCIGLEETRRARREAWLKMRQLQPKENLEEVRRRAREDWLAKHGPERK